MTQEEILKSFQDIFRETFQNKAIELTYTDLNIKVVIPTPSETLEYKTVLIDDSLFLPALERMFYALKSFLGTRGANI